jgi:hypothetical protein
MNRTILGALILLITVSTAPSAIAQTGPATPDTPEANGTETNSTATASPTRTTATTATTTESGGGEVRTPIPTPPPDSEFADPTPVEPDNGSRTPGSEGQERVDSDLILLESSYDDDAAPGENRGVVTLRLRATRTKAVTLYDAGAFELGGPLPERNLEPFRGEMTVEFTVYRPDGSEFVGVSIVTSEVVYAEPIRVSHDTEDPAPANRHYLALLVGVVGVTVSGVVIGKIRGRRREEGVMRVEG